MWKALKPTIKAMYLRFLFRFFFKVFPYFVLTAEIKNHKQTRLHWTRARVLKAKLFFSLSCWHVRSRVSASFNFAIRYDTWTNYKSCLDNSINPGEKQQTNSATNERKIFTTCRILIKAIWSTDRSFHARATST